MHEHELSESDLGLLEVKRMDAISLARSIDNATRCSTPVVNLRCRRRCRPRPEAETLLMSSER